MFKKIFISIISIVLLFNSIYIIPKSNLYAATGVLPLPEKSKKMGQALIFAVGTAVAAGASALGVVENREKIRENAEYMADNIATWSSDAWDWMTDTYGNVKNKITSADVAKMDPEVKERLKGLSVGVGISPLLYNLANDYAATLPVTDLGITGADLEIDEEEARAIDWDIFQSLKTRHGELKKDIWSSDYIQLTDGSVFLVTLNNGKFHVTDKIYAYASSVYFEKMDSEIKSILNNLGVLNLMDRTYTALELNDSLGGKEFLSKYYTAENVVNYLNKNNTSLSDNLASIAKVEIISVDQLESLFAGVSSYDEAWERVKDAGMVIPDTINVVARPKVRQLNEPLDYNADLVIDGTITGGWTTKKGDIVWDGTGNLPANLTWDYPIPDVTLDKVGNPVISVPDVYNPSVDWDIPWTLQGTNDYPISIDVPWTNVVTGNPTDVPIENVPTNIPPNYVNWRKLKNIPVAFSEKFPFSLPFDLFYLVNLLDMEPERMQFHGSFTIAGMDIPLDVEISDRWDNLAKIVRFATFLIFAIGLIFATRNLLGGGV